MSGLPGRKALVKVSGASAVFTGEACTDSGDHQTYQITAATKRVWDRTAAITVLVAAVPTVEVYTLDRLRGKVRFATVNAGRGSVTVTGSYLPVSIAAKAKAFSWSISATNLDDSDFQTAQGNGGMITRIQGLHDVSGTISRRWSVDTYFKDALLAGDPVVIEFFLDATSDPDLCVWAELSKSAVQAAVDGLVEEDIEFQGTADADGRAASLA